MIGGGDINRLAWELEQVPSGREWCEKHGLEYDGVVSFVTFHVRELIEHKNDDDIDYPLSLATAIGNAFRLGWEARHQYGEQPQAEGGSDNE